MTLLEIGIESSNRSTFFIQYSLTISLKMAFTIHAHCYKHSACALNSNTLIFGSGRASSDFSTGPEPEVTLNTERNTASAISGGLGRAFF